MLLGTGVLSDGAQRAAELEQAVARDSALDDATAGEAKGHGDRNAGQKRTVPKNFESRMTRHLRQE